MSSDRDAVTAAVTRVAREESGHVLALLARTFNSVDLADDAVQDALVQALESWQRDGIPANPAGWLMKVARNKGIDRLRRAESARRRTIEAAPELLTAAEKGTRVDVDDDRDEAGIRDERLRLMLLCCHPALGRETQVALTLRMVGGLTTPEIAAAFVVPEATMAQRIVRAKRKIRDARIPFRLPAQIAPRAEALLTVLYLVFNESYLSRGDGAEPVRVDLAAEAIRLTREALAVLPAAAEPEGLLALELFLHARHGGRVSPGGDLVLLEDQDRSLWDSALIREANAVLACAMTRLSPGPFQLQAMIAAHHSGARTAADTDWPAIVRLYNQLQSLTRSPIVALNRAIAVAMADGPHAGLRILEQVDGLEQYHLFHAARGELLLRAGNPQAALASFRTALDRTRNPAELRHLQRRVAYAGG